MRLAAVASRCISCVLLAVTGPLVAQAGVPVGAEFRVNTQTANEQDFPSVASDSAGNFVVVWWSLAQDGSDFGVFGQRYASSGARVGAEFQVNSYTTGNQSYSSVASDSSGNFVVVWWSALQDGSYFGIFGQRYASSGAPRGVEFRVNTYTTGSQKFPSVTSDSSGSFVVIWMSPQDGAGYGVFGQRYASSGAPAGAEFQVNSYTTDNQSYPRVASDASGNFVVVWTSSTQDGDGRGIFGQRYASSGAPAGGEFRVNTYTTYIQWFPSVASDPSGNFVVVWEGYNEDGSDRGVFGQRYGSSGAPSGAEFGVNTYTTSAQGHPSVALDSSGNFVVVWNSYGQDASGYTYGVFGQRYASSGAPTGSEFRVNTYTTASQDRPRVASDASGNFVVVWQSYKQDGSLLGIYGQRYGKILPVELTRLTVE